MTGKQGAVTYIQVGTKCSGALQIDLLSAGRRVLSIERQVLNVECCV